jgi:FtsP/CotA-like multicopper oxidase with cupredoxin domain
MSNKNFTRRDMLKIGAVGGAATIASKAVAQTCVDTTPVAAITDVEFTGCGYNEVFPASPFILTPFVDPLPVPMADRPGWRAPDGTLVVGSGVYANVKDNATTLFPDAWKVRKSVTFGDGARVPPGPGAGQQDALGERPVIHSLAAGGGFDLPPAGTHQLWPDGTGFRWNKLLATDPNAPCPIPGFPLPNVDPILYHIRIGVAKHGFTSSPVVNIDKAGNPVPVPPLTLQGGVAIQNGTVPAGIVGLAPAFVGQPTYALPKTTIYGFNGAFPGSRINVEYGQPVIVRFENDIDINPNCYDRQDFGAPDWAFLVHLHNGHTAPESDGNPHHMEDHEGGYQPGEWVDNLYLVYPAGNDDREKQSFLWFHDHRMHHTGPNVYKGMVGLMPHYDPVLDSGDENTGLRLPGVRKNNGDGTFDVDYDIPMALYDCCMDDGVTSHQDVHTPVNAVQAAQIGMPTNQICGAIHPEWWGQLFLKHYPNHGFVGDIFTVNCVAYPQYTVERRKYRFRFLGASLARCYELALQQGTPMPFPGSQGQWNFGVLKQGVAQKTRGTTVMNFVQIANEGGLLPTPVQRDTVVIWPAKRREVIVDFTKYANGQPTVTGDVVYLTNVMAMPDGRKPIFQGDQGFDPTFAVPMVKFTIGGAPAIPDASLMPVPGKTPLRPAPPFVAFNQKVAPAHTFILQRGGGAAGPETEWLINGAEFVPTAPLALVKVDSAEQWGIENGGGGWTHPMHIHQEEHHVIFRTNKAFPDLPSDAGKEDVVALYPSEKTVIYRKFRTFLGNYVAHCHNLAHEDHNMMFGWTIVP